MKIETELSLSEGQRLAVITANANVVGAFDIHDPLQSNWHFVINQLNENHIHVQDELPMGGRVELCDQAIFMVNVNGELVDVTINQFIMLDTLERMTPSGERVTFYVDGKLSMLAGLSKVSCGGDRRPLCSHDVARMANEIRAQLN